MSEWIPIDERLPDPETPVLIVTGEGHVVDAVFYLRGYGKSRFFDRTDSDGEGCVWLCYATHWMPLPGPPEATP